jgi:Ca-activated chloride channel family protein
MRQYPLKKILQATILILILIATVFRPYWGTTEESIATEKTTIMIALDISKSMLASDTPPSRLERAKRIARSIIDAAPRNQIVRFGLVLFAGSASLFAPPTEDTQVLETYLQTISPELIVDEGSNLIEAIEVSRQALRDSQGAILIISDGEITQDEQAITIGRAKSSSLPIFTMAVGTEAGARIPNGYSWLLDDAGQPVISKADPTFLSSIADASPNGAFLKANDTTSIIRAIKKGNIASVSKIFKNEIGYILFTACLIIMIPSLMFIPRFLLPAIALTLALGQSHAFAESLLEEATQYQAQQRYDAQDFSGAAQKFDQMKDTAQGLHGLGATAFRSGKFQEALNSFDQMYTLHAGDQNDFTSSYNAGNAALAMDEFDEAIKRYDQALSLRPKDERAITNRQIALQKKQEKQQQSSEQQQDKEQEKQKDQPNQSDSGNSSPETPKDQQQPPQDKQQKEGQNQQNKDQSEQQQRQAEASGGQRLESSDEKIAKNWINSLPEAPLLIKRDQKNSGISKQRW